MISDILVFILVSDYSDFWSQRGYCKIRIVEYEWLNGIIATFRADVSRYAFCCVPVKWTFLTSQWYLQKRKLSQGYSRAWNKSPLVLYTQLLFNHQVMSDSFAAPWTVARQPPLSMGFPRQEYWTGLPFLSSGGLPNPGIELAFPALAGGFFIAEPPGKPAWQMTMDLMA